jgi:hypothetical protein
LDKAALLYSTQFLTLAIPDHIILIKLLHYGFSSFIKPSEYSIFNQFRMVSALIHSISYLNYRLVELITKYPCFMPNVHIILGDCADLIYSKPISKLGNIILFVNNKANKLYSAILFENGRRKKFLRTLPYVTQIQGISVIHKEISMTHYLSQKLLSIIKLLFSKGSSISISKLSDTSLPTSSFLLNVVNKSECIMNSPEDNRYICDLLPIVSSPRSLQIECINRIKTCILMNKGPRHFRTNLYDLPLPVCVKQHIIS